MLTDTNEIILHIADLIEKGSQGRPQITGHYFARPDLDEPENGRCAMGACLAGVDVLDSNKLSEKSFLEWVGVQSWPKIPFPSDFSQTFAADDNNRAPLVDVVIWMNDRKEWSFSQIVAYLRSLATITPEVTPKRAKRQRRKTG